MATMTAKLTVIFLRRLVMPGAVRRVGLRGVPLPSLLDNQPQSFQKSLKRSDDSSV